jgi:hypothetical protein
MFFEKWEGNFVVSTDLLATIDQAATIWVEIEWALSFKWVLVGLLLGEH